MKFNTINTILSIFASEGLYLKQLEVITEFLHGDLDEDIYMHQPEGFWKERKKNMVCRLKKRLCGLKQAPRRTRSLKASCIRKVSNNAMLIIAFSIFG